MIVKLALSIYHLLTSCFFGVIFLPLWTYLFFVGDKERVLRQRMGHYPRKLSEALKSAPRIWLHAASVGEVKAAISIMAVLKRDLPGCGLVLSTFTAQGYKSAKTLVGQNPVLADTVCVIAPIDVVWVVRRVLLTFKPDVLAFLETELWPNLIFQAHMLGIKTVLINGRISDRSINRYLKIRPLIKGVLSTMAGFSVIGEIDAERFGRLGAPDNRISVGGNAKFDLLELPDMVLRDRLRVLYGLKGCEPVFVAGSIRGDEDELMLAAFGQVKLLIPETIMILAPRHLNRIERIEARLREQGLAFQKRSALDGNNKTRQAQVIILDTIGELHQTYGIASVVFCGGSLVPLGGQNILEPAAWGKPVLFGPSMGDFKEARDLLVDAGGAVEVTDADDLAGHLADLLKFPDKAQKMGQLAQTAVMSNKGAAQKHADIIMAAVNGKIDPA